MYCNNKKTKGLLCVLMVIAIFTAMAMPAIAAGGPVFNMEWNEPCCDGGACCISLPCSCPSCYNRGEPGGVCPDCGGDLCPDCGNCYNCGTSPCPTCRTGEDPAVCEVCGGALCKACWGCLDCGYGRDIDCPFCGPMWTIKIEETPADRGLDADAPTPLFSLGEVDVYLFAPAGMKAWALFNLLAVLGGIAISVAVFAKAALRKRREEQEHKKTGSAAKIAAMEASEHRYARKHLWLLVACFTATIGAVITLIATQDFRGAIALFDVWSILHSILLAGSVATAIMAERQEGYRNV